MKPNFKTRKSLLENAYSDLIHQKNSIEGLGNGIFQRYRFPVLTHEHIPLSWRYDFNQHTNPFFMERFGINAVFNAGAIKHENKYVLMARIEGNDRKSFFGIAQSDSGIEGFQFNEYPVLMPETNIPDINIYDPRLTKHEDGWIYAVFCTERKDPSAPPHDQSMAIAACGIARTKDLNRWERLPDLKTPSPQQRNVVLHPEFVEGKYAFYTRPQDGFIEAGSGGGIGFGLCDDICNPVIYKESIIHNKQYHTVYEAKNGAGPAPIKTELGWLHLAHGVRNTAAGLRYVLYLFVTDLRDLTKVIYKPGGYFLAPVHEERVGDVSNVVFSNGWIADDDGTVYIYYASSDTRMHVAVSSIDQLLDYVKNTPEDGFRSVTSVEAVTAIINQNKEL